jgi:hypothetical protein
MRMFGDKFFMSQKLILVGYNQLIVFKKLDF